MLNDYLPQMAPEYRSRRPLSQHANFAERVERLVMEECGVTVEEFWSKKKLRHIAWARFLVWAMLFQRDGFRTLEWIGKRYGRDHSTIHSGIQIVKTTPALFAVYDDLLFILGAELEMKAFGQGKDMPNDNSTSS